MHRKKAVADLILAAEWGFPGEHLEQDGPDTPEVRLRAVLVPLQNFWGLGGEGFPRETDVAFIAKDAQQFQKSG